MRGRPRPEVPRVLVWGASVGASALAAGLAGRVDVEVARVVATLDAAGDALRDGDVDALLCDRGTVAAADVLTLLAGHPGVRCMLVDLDTEDGLVVSGSRARTRTADDVAAALLGPAAPDAERDPAARPGPSASSRT